MTPVVNCLLADLPVSIPAYVVSNPDDSYTIVLNARHSHEQHLISYHHEMSHIENHDYEKSDSDLIEIHSHHLKQPMAF